MNKTVLFAFCIFAFATAQAAQDPEAVFNRACGMCHNGQLPQAPKKGDQAAWKPRLTQGEAVLVQHVTQGFNAMPAGGLCADCSADDYKGIIQWMSK